MSTTGLGQVSNRPLVYNEPKIINKPLVSKSTDTNVEKSQEFFSGNQVANESLNIPNNGSAITSMPLTGYSDLLSDVKNDIRVISLGSYSQEVIDIKSKLNEFRAANNLPLIQITPDYDLQTQETIKQFQKSQGIEPTGAVGSNTLLALEKLTEEPKSIWQNISSSVVSGINSTKNQLNSFYGAVSNSTVGKAVGSAYNTGATGAANFINYLNSTMDKASKNVSTGMTNFGNYISNSAVGRTVSSGYNQASTTVTNAGNYISNSAVGRTVNSFSDTISNTFTKVRDKFSKYLDGAAFAVGEKLKNVAETVERIMPDPRPKQGKCYTAVKFSLAAMGIPYVEGSGSAYQAVNDIFTNPKYKHLFKKMDVDQSDLKNLPAGAIIVWPKTKASPHGHIGISDGKGKDLSDADRNALSSLRGNTKCQVFFPTGTLNPPNPEAVKIMKGIENNSLNQMQRARA